MSRKHWQDGLSLMLYGGWRSSRLALEGTSMAFISIQGNKRVVRSSYTASKDNMPVRFSLWIFGMFASLMSSKGDTEEASKSSHCVRTNFKKNEIQVPIYQLAFSSPVVFQIGKESLLTYFRCPVSSVTMLCPLDKKTYSCALLTYCQHGNP